jgi:hypothetical protein
MSVELRNFIVEHFNRDELLTFCADYFRDFYEDNEGNPITKAALARDLIEHCQHRSLIDALKANLQKERPEPFERKFGRTIISVVQPQPRNPQQIFLSYSIHDLRFAQRFAADLRAEGVPVWAAFDSIRPGESWTNAIDRGLSESGIFVVLLTPHSVSSQWVKTEVQFAIQEQQSGEGRLVPLMIQTCNVRQLSALLTTLQHIDFANGYEQGLAQTFQVLGLPVAASRIWNAIAQREAEERKQREQQENERAKEAEAQRLDEERKKQDKLEAKRLHEATLRQAEEERKQREQLEMQKAQEAEARRVAEERNQQEEQEVKRLREDAALRQNEKEISKNNKMRSNQSIKNKKRKRKDSI